jgi:hypothetical protein
MMPWAIGVAIQRFIETSNYLALRAEYIDNTDRERRQMAQLPGKKNINKVFKIKK